MADDITFITAKTKEVPTLLKEYSLSTDSYKTPLTYKNFNAFGTLMMRLMLLEPGTITHSPEMGLGLISKYRYMHSIWHIWILVGSILHFLCIFLYVINSIQ